jgi:glycosyltransferase involved in cell wall biosynthesis
MSKILVYRNSLLQPSETFIKEQMLAYRRWHGVLVGMWRVPNGLSLDGLDFILLRPKHPGVLDRIVWKASQALRTPQPWILAKLRHEGASLLHVHFGVDALEAWPLARALDLPMLVTLHGYDINIDRGWWEAGHGGQSMRDYPARLIELARQPRVRFIAVSEAIRSRAIQYGIPEDKLSVRYIGVDRTKFVPSGRPITGRERRVLFVGRLVEKKGCRYLIQAFAKVQEIVPDALLVIAGDGELRDQLQEMARQLGICAHFRGALSNAEVRRELDLARVFCLPSVTALNGDAEGFGVVILEAQASGVPVVTSATGGASEGLEEGTTGFTFGERDVDTLAGQLTALLTDDAMATSMALAGPRLVSERFDLHRCTEQLESLYDETSARWSPSGNFVTRTVAFTATQTRETS